MCCVCMMYVNGVNTLFVVYPFFINTIIFSDLHCEYAILVSVALTAR